MIKYISLPSDLSDDKDSEFPGYGAVLEMRVENCTEYSTRANPQRRRST